MAIGPKGERKVGVLDFLILDFLTQAQPWPWAP
jgi:hypothetical protein